MQVSFHSWISFMLKTAFVGFEAWVASEKKSPYGFDLTDFVPFFFQNMLLCRLLHNNFC